MNSGQLKRAKKRVRQTVLARRDAVSPEERARLSVLVTDRMLALSEIEDAGTVMAFWSFGSELATMPLIRALSTSGIRVVLPRIVDGDLEARTWRPGEPTTATSFGALEPAEGDLVDPADVDVIVTPAVAVDRAGRRVGYGGGYYDRFFPRARGDAFRVAAVLGVQLVDDDLPSGHFDLRVHAVVTESETIRCLPKP